MEDLKPLGQVFQGDRDSSDYLPVHFHYLPCHTILRKYTHSVAAARYHLFQLKKSPVDKPAGCDYHPVDRKWRDHCDLRQPVVHYRFRSLAETAS